MLGKKLILIAMLIGCWFIFTGCGGNFFSRGRADDDDSLVVSGESGSPRASAGRSAKKPGKVSADERDRPADVAADELSPAASIRRDRELLMAKAREQVKKLQEMNSVLSQNEESIAREQRQLAQVNQRIQEFDEALHRFEAAPDSTSQSPYRREPGYDTDRFASTQSSRRGVPGLEMESETGTRQQRDYASEDKELVLYNPYMAQTATNLALNSAGPDRSVEGRRVFVEEPTLASRNRINPATNPDGSGVTRRFPSSKVDRDWYDNDWQAGDMYIVPGVNDISAMAPADTWYDDGKGLNNQPPARTPPQATRQGKRNSEIQNTQPAQTRYN
ncbi:MAG: hypothetical protein LIP23_07875, partial [Planctomycetes bacterium]|nr:hypothetical protein [Planctomycetota bacterium]